MIIAALNSYAEAPETNGYVLVWSDEFENEGKPDAAKWTYEHGFARNKELQWYQPSNASCGNGLLVIEARRERRPNPAYRKDQNYWKSSRQYIEYTSACVNTRGLHSWQYGLFEVKARIKTEAGLWPAIWFLGVDGRWPHNGEIDLMEYYDDSILANACWGAPSQWAPVWDSVKKPVSSFNDAKWDERFHVWRMLWNEERIELYVDDILLNTIDLSETVNPKADRGPGNPFHQPHYLLLNLALGGTNGGDVSMTSFPSRYEIDYVRVYQKE
jgi:beta-glucanase (GH16 family)